MDRQSVDGPLASIMAWIDVNLHEPLTLRMLAVTAEISTRTLSRRFEVETGRGPLQWVGERRIARARALLEETELSITDVAFAAGFGSLGAFRRQFHHVTGTTPSNYRLTFTNGVC